jgi:hypothetical protein
MSLDASEKAEIYKIAKFFHDILLGYMEFTMGIVPISRLQNITDYINKTMYHLMDFEMLGLIKYNDPVATIEAYCRFLEENNLAEKVSMTPNRERLGTRWRITVTNCLFGNSCRKLEAGRFMCPAALIAGFLAHEAGSQTVRMNTSSTSMVGCHTVISVADQPMMMKKIILPG